MKYASVNINLKPYSISKFDSITEALTLLPEAIVLRYINMCWRDTQMVKLVDAYRQAKQEKR